MDNVCMVSAKSDSNLYDGHIILGARPFHKQIHDNVIGLSSRDAR